MRDTMSSHDYQLRGRDRLSIVRLFLLSSATLLTGCFVFITNENDGTHPVLRRGAERITVVAGRDPENCEYRGLVEAAGDDGANVPSNSSDVLGEHTLTDLRNKAASLSADYVVVDAKKVHTTYLGRAFRCRH